MNKVIHSVAEYVELIMNENNHAIRNGTEKNEKLVFRGQEDKDYELLPSIARNRHGASDKTILDEERNLIEMAKYKLPNIFQKDLNPIELLALLQHHGIPTRLLDVTDNALVALYFACESNKECNAEVIVFKYDEYEVTNYPVNYAIAETYKFAYGNVSNLISFYERMVKQPYFLEQKYDLMKYHVNNTNKIDWLVEQLQKPIFIYAPIHEQRQFIQGSRFILFPNSVEVIDLDIVLEKFIKPLDKNSNYITLSIEIPFEEKMKIIQELKLLGISRESLFFDNPDIVCGEIVNYFKEKIRK